MVSFNLWQPVYTIKTCLHCVYYPNFFRQTNHRDGEILAKRFGCSFAETSAKVDSPKSLLIPFVKEILQQYTALLTVDFDKQGWLLRQEGKIGLGLKERYFILKENSLFYSTESDTKTQKVCNGINLTDEQYLTLL